MHNISICRGFKKCGKRCNYMNQENFFCKIHSKQYEGIMCSICHEETTKSESIITECDHIFHNKCLQEWRNNENGTSCPLCRHPIKRMDKRKVEMYRQMLLSKYTEYDVLHTEHVNILKKRLELSKELIQLARDINNSRFNEEPCNVDGDFLAIMINTVWKLQKSLRC